MSLASAIVSAIEREGWGVFPGFLSAADVQSHRERILRDRELLRPAGIGSDASRVESVRGDFTRWWEPSALSPEQLILWDRFEEIRRALNERLFLGLADLEGHDALYPPGGHYERHLDRFRDPKGLQGARTVSLVLYFNEPDWSGEDGGQLRIWPATSGGHVTDKCDWITQNACPGTGEPLVEISPRGGTLVAFLSADFPHEVVPSKRDRLSFAGWFRRRP